MCKPAVPRCGHAASSGACTERWTARASACPASPALRAPPRVRPRCTASWRARSPWSTRGACAKRTRRRRPRSASPQPRAGPRRVAVDRQRPATTAAAAKNASPLARSSTRSSALRRCAARTIPCSSMFLCGFSDDRTDGQTRNTRPRNTRGAGTRRATPMVTTRGQPWRALTCGEARLDFPRRSRRCDLRTGSAGRAGDPSRRRPRRSLVPPSATRASSETRRPRCASRCAQKKRARSGGGGGDAGVPVACSDPTARREPLA